MDDPLLWQRWAEIDRLVDESLDMPRELRVAHILRRTEDDADLRALVLRLVGSVDDDNARVSGPSEAVVLGAFAAANDDAALEDLTPGTVVGRYVVGNRRGRGGMATVYDAERSDGTYEQRVALKVLRRGLDTADLIRRFVQERQLLSSFAHPNIARLLDGGALEDGRPYLVMELVDGRSITQHADDAQLDVRERLELFLQVADAVRVAHRRLVVHRDIKPSNILVDAEGRVKLLDFGIAKLLEADSGMTDGRFRALTPDYASPEQVRGDEITTGTDVYQLGLLLRELLVGLSPLAGGGKPGEPLARPSDAALQVFDGAPPPDARAACRRTSPAKLVRTLRGELDLIVGKALRVDPDERYATANELADDVRNFLGGRPIKAHPESAAYRIRKLASVHPLLVPVVLVAALALAAFVTMLEVQNRRITHERDGATAASRRALATQQFLVELLRAPDPQRDASDGGGRDMTVVDALQQGRVRAADELRDEPEVHAAVLEAIGRTFSGLGRYETADTLLQSALKLHTQHYGPTAPQTVGVLEQIGANFRQDRAFRGADSVYHEALHRRMQSGAHADTAIAGLLEVLSATRRELGDVDSSLTLARRAVAARIAAGDTTSRRFVSGLMVLAFALRGANHLDSAELLYREVLRRRLNEAEPEPLGLAGTYNNLAYLLKLKEDFVGAESMYREAIRLARTRLGDGHATTLLYSSNLVGALEPQGKLDEIVEIGRARIAAAEQEWPQGHWRVGSAHAALGRFLLRHQRSLEAEPALAAAVNSYRATLGESHAWTAQAEIDHGIALLLSGQRTRGNTALDRSVRLLLQLTEQLGNDGRFNLGRSAATLEAAGHRDRAQQLRDIIARSAQPSR